MSTRGYFWFIDGKGCKVGIYKHCDCYPDGEHGGIAAIKKAMPLAWELPRFEADEFASAFVAASKECEGGIRIRPEPSADCEYIYEVRQDGAFLSVTVTDVYDGTTTLATIRGPQP